MFASDQCVYVRVCSNVDTFRIRQQERLTDCVWEVEGRNSRGFNHLSLYNTHNHTHTDTHTQVHSSI